MDIETQLQNLPRLENIMLPIDFDPYIKFFESIYEIAKSNPRYVAIRSEHLNLHNSLTNPTDLIDILLALDDLAENFNDDTPRAIGSYRLESDTLVFELDAEA